MSYEAILSSLFEIGNLRGMKMGLEVACALDEALDFPTRSYATIHVAGSNGKGSVSTKIAKGLSLAGLRVGLYTSPHLFTFRERIQIDGVMISEEEVESELNALFSLEKALGLESTFFELTTFLAFNYFRKQQVDVAVIETGLGGRLDATAIIHPVLSVITSISEEHTQLLGKDLELIAKEKAGIIKPKVPLIIGPRARLKAVYDRAAELDAPVLVSKKIHPFFDEENSAIATLALCELKKIGFSLENSHIEEGAHARPLCRFQKVGRVIFDVAHNPDAIFSLLQALHLFYPQERFRFVVGFCQDKEYDRCLDLIAAVAVHIHLVQGDTPRSATPHQLAQTLSKESPSLYTEHDSISEGVQAALKGSEQVVVCGSFYLMAKAYHALGLEVTEDLPAFSPEPIH